MEHNLTKGSVFKNIVLFSLPFLLSYFLQTLYGLADLFIIGQFCEVESTTAVSAGSQIMHMVTVMIVGLATGSLVLIGRAVGAGDSALRNKAIGNTVSLFALVSLVLTGVLLVCAMPIVHIMQTPAEAIHGTYIYVLICFAGIPFITAYNIISSIFRGMGDSKSPMYFILIACICNIALDYLFIGACGLGPAGAALGTTLAQTVSVIISLIAIRRKKMIEGLSRAHLCLEKSTAGSIVRVGLPVALQDGFIQISFLVITIFANLRGVDDAAAVGIVEKLIGILFLIPSTLLSSVSALCAQNIGAGEHGRARKTMLYAMAITTGFGLFFSVLFQFIAGPVIDLFTNNATVVTMGTTYMRSYVVDCIFAAIHFIFSGYFCAYSRSEISFIHNAISAVFFRIPLSYLASTHFKDTLFPMGCAAPIGSLVSISICFAAYLLLQRSLKRQMPESMV